MALTLGIIAILTLVHFFGIRLASHPNNAGVCTELLGLAIVSLVLMGIALTRDASPAVRYLFYELEEGLKRPFIVIEETPAVPGDSQSLTAPGVGLVTCV